MAIPLLPGVPPLKTDFKNALIANGTVALADALVSPASQKWGLYNKKGKRALQPDSFMGVDYRNNWRVSKYPVEQGKFSSYNKVNTPFAATVWMSKGGSLSERANFIIEVDKLANNLTPYDIITPEINHLNVTVEDYEYSRRVEKGAGVIIVGLHFTEIRVTAAIQYRQTRSGKQISSQVPTAQKTQPTTSTGLASKTATTAPSAQATYQNGSVARLTKTVDTTGIQ